MTLIREDIIMSIDDKKINEIERLSKIEASEEEKEELKDYLEEAAEYLDKMKEVHIDELSLLTDISNDIFREDVPGDFDNKESLLQEAHEKYGKYFSIPTVLDGELKS